MDVPPPGPKETRSEERFLEEEREGPGRTTVGEGSGTNDQLDAPNVVRTVQFVEGLGDRTCMFLGGVR